MSTIDTSTFKEFIFALFIGRSASGKSAAAASFPGRFLELDFDLRANGIINAINQGWLKQDKMDIHRFDPFDGYAKVLEYMNHLHLGTHNNTFNYKSIDMASLGAVCRLLTVQSFMSPRGQDKNIRLLTAATSDPSDYKFESQNCHRLFDFLRTFPCNVTVACHIINQWGKKPGSPEYAPAGIIGEKLSITANLGESILGIFNDVYKFTKETSAGAEKFYVEFSTEIARNSYGIPPGKFDITRKEFYPFLVNLILKVRNGEAIKPDQTETNSIFNFGG